MCSLHLRTSACYTRLSTRLLLHILPTVVLGVDISYKMQQWLTLTGSVIAGQWCLAKVKPEDGWIIKFPHQPVLMDTLLSQSPIQQIVL